MKKALSLLLALALCLCLLPASAFAADSDFDIDEYGVLIEYTGPGGDVVIPDGVTEIGGQVFYGCTGLTSVTIPSSVTWINDGAFWGCTNLTSVTIPNGVTTIGELAFCGCASLTSVTIPNSVIYILSFAFSECKGLTSLTIPNGVTYISHRAFSGCTGLTSVTIPDSITSISYGAFLGCTGLTDVYYEGTEAQWGAVNIDNGNNDNDPLINATVHYNSKVPTPTAVSAPQTVKLDGEDVVFPAAYQIAGHNYVKLRDLATVLSGTAAQFEVGWDGAANCISLTTGQPYTAVGGELAPIPDEEQTYEPCTSTILLNGEAVELEAYTINQNNYFKLRDLGKAMDFNVSWIDNGVVIAPGEPYDAN